MRLAAVVISLVVLHACVAYPNSQPVIGVLLETVYQTTGQYKAQAAYRSFIEQGGGGAVPIFVNQSDVYYENLMSRLNGVLLPGGGVDLLTSPYGKAAYRIYKMAMEMNAKGIHFPIWGTCLGMQEMTTWPFSPRKNLVSSCVNTSAVSLPIIFTEAATSSKLFAQLPSNIKQFLSTDNVTANFHKYCLTTETYKRNKELSQFYSVLSTNYDASGIEFVSTFEARQYPFFGVQWHPEKNNYYPTHNSTINHSLDAVLVSQHFGNFLVGEAKRNHQSFKSYEEERRFLFNSYSTSFSKETAHEYYFLSDSDIPKFD